MHPLRAFSHLSAGVGAGAAIAFATTWLISPDPVEQVIQAFEQRALVDMEIAQERAQYLVKERQHMEGLSRAFQEVMLTFPQKIESFKNAPVLMPSLSQCVAERTDNADIQDMSRILNDYDERVRMKLRDGPELRTDEERIAHNALLQWHLDVIKEKCAP